MSQSIVVIGSSNIDFIMKMDHLPARDETVTEAVFMQTFGGKGANQAVAAGRAERVDAAREVIASAAYVLMQFEIPRESIARVLDIAAEERVPVVWNYAPA